jgi:DNA-nicking Smr family endonuclease
MRVGATGKPRPRRPRQLSDHERELWTLVTRAIEPLEARARPDVGAAAADESELAEQSASAVLARPPPSAPLPARDLAPFDRRLKQRLARGILKVDGSIDLHGLTLSKAHAALTAFLTRARARNARVLLVITGKGGSRGAPGVLREQVPLWLKSVALRESVLAIEPADVGHGGAGALYVRLRRPRPR